MFEQFNKSFNSTLGSIKGAFVTKPFVPTAYQANPGSIVDALENSFKEMFGEAPELAGLKTITPRQEYAGGENVFTYGADIAKMHLTTLYKELDEAVRYFAIRGTMIVWSLPEKVSDKFDIALMGMACQANQFIYTVKHADFDVGKFAAKVTIQLHATKIAMKRRNRKVRTGVQQGEAMYFLHTKQVVLSSGVVLTAQLDSDGTVVLFHSRGSRSNADVNWHEERSAVSLIRVLKQTGPKSYTWNENDFNAAFVKLVTLHVPQHTEELAQAALGAKPMTKSSVIKEFADDTKVAKDAAKEAAKVAKEQPAEAAPEVTEPSAETASVFTAAEQELVDKMKHDCPNFVARIEITEGGVRVMKFDHIDGLVAPVVINPALDADAITDVSLAIDKAPANPGVAEDGIATSQDKLNDVTTHEYSTETIARDLTAYSPTVTEDSATPVAEVIVNMGELSGVPARQVKPCRDTNAIRVVGKVISKKAKHVNAAAPLVTMGINTITYCEDTDTLYVRSTKFNYSIICDVKALTKSVFTLQSNDLQALGEAIDYDFNKFTKEYFITSNVLMTKLLGNGGDLDPLVFDLK